ncbi:MAG TPA: hypothetical protein VHO06_06415 [Polyangia bacterium]|nr:hypothetical protein [Polyangia bacterium]
MKLGSTACGRAAALACLLGGCATINSGPYGVPVDAGNRPLAAAVPPPLLVSASEVTSYSTRYLGLVEVTFENRTAVWKQVDRVSLDFGSAAKDQSVTIAGADDIDAWERAITIRNALQGLPRAGGGDIGIEALGLDAGDALGAWAVHRPPAAAAPDTAAPPTAGGPPPNAAPPAPVYPVQHLLTTPFRIPPGLFAKRWILLTTPDNPPGGCVSSMILSYETSDHATARVRLPFKDTMSEWQPACATTTPGPTFTH